MNRVSKIGLFAVLVMAFVLPACLPNSNFPDTPVIEYNGFTKKPKGDGTDSTGILSISFTDGDGDIGLAQGDTFPPYNFNSEYYYNFFTRYYEKQDGEFVEVVLDPPNNYRIPVLTPEGQNKSLEGDIQVELYINNPLSEYDTIMFEVWIVDRALRESNVIKTEEIAIQK